MLQSLRNESKLTAAQNNQTHPTSHNQMSLLAPKNHNTRDNLSFSRPLNNLLLKKV